jgi:hypothetical protein
VSNDRDLPRGLEEDRLNQQLRAMGMSELDITSWWNSQQSALGRSPLSLWLAGDRKSVHDMVDGLPQA